MNAIISHGVIPSARTLLDEPAILVQSLTLTPQRTEQRFKSGSRATVGLTETDPIMDLAFQGIILDPTGLADAHPGTQLLTLANFASPIHGFDPEQGIIIFRDPSNTKDTENPDSTSFTATHFPFLSDPIAAAALLGEGDAAILATAKTPGTAGNALSVEVVIVPDSVELTVVEVAGKTTLRGGNKRVMVVVIDSASYLLNYFYPENGGRWQTWDGVNFPADSTHVRLRGVNDTWEIEFNPITDPPTPPATADSPSGFDWPDEVPYPGGWTNSFLDSVTAAPATAAQAIALDQSALPVALTLVGDGTAPLAAVAETQLTGGR